MEEVHARQPSHVLLRLELRETDGALVRLLFLLLSLTGCGCIPLGELVRESVSLNARARCSSCHASPCSTSFGVQP